MWRLWRWRAGGGGSVSGGRKAYVMADMGEMWRKWRGGIGGISVINGCACRAKIIIKMGGG